MDQRIPTARRARPRPAPIIACAAAAALTAGALSGYTPANTAHASTLAAVPAALPSDSLVLDYTFEADTIDGSTVVDQSPRGLDGAISNFGADSLVEGRTPGTTGLDLTGGPTGSTTAPFVTVPNGLFSDTAAVTVSAWTKWSGSAGFQWLYGLGKDADNSLFFTPKFTDSDNFARTSVKQVTGGGQADASYGTALPADTWVNVTTVLDGSTIISYLNGLEVSRGAAPLDVAATLGSTEPASSGYIGRPFWNVHPFYDGVVDDFQVYSAALTPEQVAELAGPAVPTVESVTQTTVEASTAVGVAPALPGVKALFSDGVERETSVTWDEVPAEAYQSRRSSFTVNGVVDATGTAVTATVAVVAEGELSIDLSETTGAFMGGASGTLYGLYGQDLPSNNLLEGIKLRTVATKAQDGPQHPGADALEVVKPLADSSDGDVYIYMTDIYRGFPYQVPGNSGDEKLADFKAKIATQVDQVLELPAEYQDNIVFVPFNEPEGNMFGNGGESFYGVSWLDDPAEFLQAWDEVHALIKGKMPDARIAGPNTSVLFDQVRGFLRHTLAEDTVPEVMTWHELSDPASIRRNVDRYRAWEAEDFVGTAYEGEHLPINLNEYAFNYHTSVPGQMIQWVSALEDKKVDGDIAYWNIDGNLSDSAVQANRGNGQWWLLNSYGQMTGDTVTVNPPSAESYTLQGVATLDTGKKRAQALFGGSAGDQSVYFDEVPADVFGSTVHALVREIRWTGQLGDSGEPQVVKEFDVPVVDGTVQLQFGAELPQLDADSAYEVVLTPGANATSPAQPIDTWRAKYEAEDAAHSGTGWSRNGPEGTPGNVGGFYTSGNYNVGGLRTGSDVKLDFAVEVPETGSYDLSLFASAENVFGRNAEQGPVNVFVTVDGGAEQEVFLPLGYKWVVWDHADTTIDLTAGAHTISVSAKSLDGSRGTKGDAILDKIELALPNPDAASIYEAENATLSDSAVTDYSRTGVSGSGVVELTGEATSTFWVYSQADAASTLSFSAEGESAVTVNGVEAGSLSGDESITAFLSGGVNKIVVTAATGELVLDRVVVSEPDAPVASESYEAEDAALAGTAAIRPLTLASGGEAVGTIGGEPGNDSALTFDSVTAPADGTYALTIRYSNEEQSPATHYNPDPLARLATLSVNGTESTVTFPHSFHQNNFWELTVPVTLQKGENTISFRSEEKPNFDGVTYISDQFPGVLLRSKYAPNIDRISITPFVVDDAPTPEPTIEVDRIAGADRYEVAVNTSKAGFPDGSNTVYVASGAVFPDALSAAPAATVAGAPILLTTTADLPAGVAAEIKRLGASKIVIVGGTSTVSANVEASLKKLGAVTRIGGADRYEASRNIAKAAFPDGAPTAVLAAGTTFADALSAGAAIDGEGPVILVNGAASTLDAATKNLLADLDVKSIAIAGGEASVSAGIQTDAVKIATTVRLGGVDRYEASRSINDHFFSEADHVLLATGLKFSDALSGSAYGPRIDAPLFTVKADCVPAPTLAQIRDLGATKVTLLGGPASLSAALEDLEACTS
ncbi:cell wall-binding repeat-containing protein [Herbiconiux liukaitaii]|uniref:cell wall-binding repeat-containing protein n=1 Tax=Herbiconiux liukaitaii TaxID=3342799 RepID=UPI0035B79FC0